MNIVVIGSCTDSSNLAKELNKRLHNSIIARIDMLKNIKQLVLQGTGVNTSENIGTYVGDVEVYDFSKITPEKQIQISATLESIVKNLNALPKETYNDKSLVLGTFDALTNSLPTGTYSFIKVYSGAVDDQRLLRMTNDSTFLSNSIFVSVKNPANPLLPISVSTETIDKVKNNAFAYIVCDTVQEVFKSKEFQLLFSLNEDKTPVKETKVDILAEEDHDVILPGIQGGNINLVHMDRAFNNMVMAA